MRAVGAIDAAVPASRPTPTGIVTLRNVLPDWGVRLVVGTLLLPALLAALDAFFRARRRRVAIAPWLAWLAVAAVPLLVAWLWLRALGAAGLLDARRTRRWCRARYPVQTSGIVALASAAVAAALATWGVRFAARALAGRTQEDESAGNGRRRPAPGVEGLAVATCVWLCAVVTVAWVLNPYAAGLLIPAAHLWLFAAGGWRGRGALARAARRPRLAGAGGRPPVRGARPRPARAGLGRRARRRRGARGRHDAALRRAAGGLRRRRAR